MSVFIVIVVTGAYLFGSPETPFARCWCLFSCALTLSTPSLRSSTAAAAATPGGLFVCRALLPHPTVHKTGPGFLYGGGGGDEAQGARGVGADNRGHHPPAFLAGEFLSCCCLLWPQNECIAGVTARKNFSVLTCHNFSSFAREPFHSSSPPFLVLESWVLTFSFGCGGSIQQRYSTNGAKQRPTPPLLPSCIPRNAHKPHTKTLRTTGVQPFQPPAPLGGGEDNILRPAGQGEGTLRGGRAPLPELLQPSRSLHSCNEQVCLCARR